MIKILQILAVNLPLVFDTSGVFPTRPLMRIALNEQQEVRSIQPNLVIPQNVLYRVNANPTNRVLIETDPDFTNQKRWLSSDYMFNALRYEPNAVQKRLGDGFYEQRLVREQINRLTGRNFVGDYTDFDSQYRGLMDAGVTFAQKFNLRPGIALSSDQVAQLTADIVWLESEQVTLPNGKVENVLVPKVYALAKKGDITGNGALLSGNKVIHKGGEFINSGTVAGREVVQFDSESIRNSGNISGGAIVGKVSGDMENLGGTLEADRAILLNVAGNFNHTSQTHTTSVNERGYQRTDTTIGRKGLLHVKGENGTLQIQANNIHLAGADIINDGQGQTYLSAKNNLNLTALSVGFDEKMGGGNHYRNEAVQGVEISRVQGKGDVVLSGQNIYSEAAQLEAKQHLALLAENDVVLGTASTSREFEEYHKTKSKNVFGSSSKETFTAQSATAEQSSTLLGQDVVLQAGNNATLIGTQGAATGNIQVIAGNAVLLDAALNTEETEAWEKRKKAGFTFEKSGGSARMGVGASRLKEENQQQSTQVTGVNLTALSGNLTVVAGANLTANAATLEAGKDLHLQGKNVALNAVNEQQDSQYRREEKSAGLGIGVNYNPVEIFKQAYGEQAGQGSDGSIVGKAVTGGEALDKTSQKMTQQFMPYLSAKSSKTAQTRHQETAVVSQLNAGGNLSITATEGNISAQGALLSAKGDGNLWAKDNITLDVATSRQHQSSESRQKGVDIDFSRRATDINGIYAGKTLGNGERESQQASVLSFGGESRVTAQSGNLTFVGTQLVSEGDNHLSAGKNIQITTATDRSQQTERDTFHGWGEAVVSDTERFSGYNRKLSSQSGEQVLHKGATVASLNGNTTLTAGEDIAVTSGQILAKNHLLIDAENVTFDIAYNQEESQSKQSDLKMGMFARISSPIIDLIQTVEKTVKDKDAGDRLKAAQLMGAAAKGYSDYTDAAAGGALLRAEVGAGFSHSRQRQESEAQISQGNTVNAKEITITARSGNLTATQTNFTSRDSEGKRIEGSRVTLNAAKDIVLQAGESHEQRTGKQQNAGVEVGVGVSVGAQTGVYVYGQAGFGNGKQNETHTTYQNSHLDTETLSLNSGGDTTLKGATARAKQINADVKGDLRIESQQDEHRSESQNAGVGIRVQASIGSAWGASGYGNASSGNAYSKQVNEQSGLFAEEGGYHIHADNVHLKGGAIASTNAQNSELTTNKFTFEDIQNTSESQAITAGLSGSANLTKAVGNAPRTDAEAQRQADDAKLHGTPQKNGISPSIPMYERSHDSSTTKATLTEGNITLNKDSQPTKTTAKALGINTDITQANEQVEAAKDINKVLKEQQILSQAGGNVAGAVMSYANRQAEVLEEKAKRAEQEAQQAAKEGDLVTATQKAQEAAAYQQAATEWQTGGDKKQAATAVATALSLAVAGKPTEAVVAGAASPYVNEAIKKATDSPELQALNIPAHILWGAVEAELSGGSATAGAVAAGVGEAGAKILSETVYGKSPTDLTETEKQELIQVIKGIAGVAGGVAVGSDSTAGTLATVSTGITVAENAVEFNGLLDTQVSHLFKDLEKAEKEGKSLEEIFTEYKQLSDKQFKDIQENCDSAVCRYGAEKLNEEANQKALELVGFFNSKLSTLSDSAQENFVEFVIEENAKELDFINGARTPAEKAIVFLVDAFVESRESQGLNVSPKIAGFAKKNAKISSNSSPIPVPNPIAVQLENGMKVTYKSNSKHTKGMPGNRPNAGIEPRDSLELFKKSIEYRVESNKVIRYAKDSQGNVHRFFGTNGEYHWSGSSGDSKNPLPIPKDLKF